MQLLPVRVRLPTVLQELHKTRHHLRLLPLVHNTVTFEDQAYSVCHPGAYLV